MSQEKSLLELFREWQKEKANEMLFVNDIEFFDEISLHNYCKANLVDIHNIYSILKHLTEAVSQMQNEGEE